MKRTWTSDAPSSFTWYQSLFGQPETQPSHADFGQIRDSDGTVLLRSTSGVRNPIRRCRRKGGAV